jgi:hypothetical protein
VGATGIRARAQERSEFDAGWEGHSLAQLRRLAQPTLIEKLEWLEQAQRMVEAMRRERPPEQD